MLNFATGHYKWRNLQGTEGLTASRGKLNVKTGPYLVYILALVFCWFSVGYCFLRFSEYFPVI